MAEFLFWFFIWMIAYTYFGYPILLSLYAKGFRRAVKTGVREPAVSVVLSAFNEENEIERKLLNILSLDYPDSKLEVLVGSDGAQDLTDELVCKFRHRRIRFFRFVSNHGKPNVLNALMREARGEIVVFTDARQELAPDAIRALVRNFGDPKVGCVSGELHFRGVTGEGISKGMDAYWTYEKFLRRCESQIGSILGVTGALYAIRRHLFPKLPENILVDDMYVPLSIVNRNYRVVFEPKAAAYDRVSTKGKEEWRRKVRTLAGNYQIFQSFPHLLHPTRSSIAWQLFSHKFLRLMVPFFMLGIWITNSLLLREPFYQVLFAAQIIFYLCAFWGSLKGAGICYTFCLLNYSAVAGFIHYLSKRRNAAWEKAYV